MKIKNRRIKLLFFNHQAEMGGAEFSLFETLKNIDKDNFDVSVILGCEGPFRKNLEEEGLKVKVLNLPKNILSLKRSTDKNNSIKSFTKAIFDLFVSKKLIKEGLNKEKPDLLIFNTVKSACLGSSVANKLGIKTAWIVRDMLTKDFFKRFYLNVIRFLTRKVSKVICISNCVKEAYSSLDYLSNKDISVLYVGILYDGLTLPKLKKVSNLNPVISLIGRLEPWKGQDVFIKAAAILLRKNPKISFLIVGSPLFERGDYENKCKELVKSLDIEKNVSFLGFRKDVSEIISSSDLVIHSSIKPEPFGRVIVEAMACGTPVIATNIGGPKEIITNNKNGVLIEPNNPKLLAETILNLLKDKKKMKELGKNAIKRARDFDSKINAEVFEKIVKQTLKFTK